MDGPFICSENSIAAANLSADAMLGAPRGPAKRFGSQKDIALPDPQWAETGAQAGRIVHRDLRKQYLRSGSCAVVDFGISHDVSTIKAAIPTES